MTTPLTKLIAENKERPIADAPRDGTRIIGSFGDNKYAVIRWESVYHREGVYTGWVIYGIKERWWMRLLGSGNCALKPEMEPTHFRPLPDDRLAVVAECQDDGYQTIIKHFPEAEVLVNKIREKANRIAEGKE